MDTTRPGTDDPMTASDSNRRIPVPDHARRYMDPFAHLAHRMVESSAGMDHARRLAEWLPAAMNRQAAGNTNAAVEEFYPVDARRFGAQIPGSKIYFIVWKFEY